MNPAKVDLREAIRLIEENDGIAFLIEQNQGKEYVYMKGPRFDKIGGIWVSQVPLFNCYCDIDESETMKQIGESPYLFSTEQQPDMFPHLIDFKFLDPHELGRWRLEYDEIGELRDRILYP